MPTPLLLGLIVPMINVLVLMKMLNQENGQELMLVVFVKTETQKEPTICYLVKLNQTVIMKLEKCMNITNTGLLLMSDSVNKESEKTVGLKKLNVILLLTLYVLTLFVQKVKMLNVLPMLPKLLKFQIPLKDYLIIYKNQEMIHTLTKVKLSSEEPLIIPLPNL